MELTELIAQLRQGQDRVRAAQVLELIDFLESSFIDDDTHQLLPLLAQVLEDYLRRN